MNCGSPARFWSAPVFWRFGDAGEPTESARRLAQSKTLPRDPQVHGPNALGERKEPLHEPIDPTLPEGELPLVRVRSGPIGDANIAKFDSRFCVVVLQAELACRQ